MTSASSSTKSHFMAENKTSNAQRPTSNAQFRINRLSCNVQRSELSVGRFLHPSLVRRSHPRTFATALARFPAGEKPMPEPSDGWLLLVAPGEVAILAVKLLGNDFQSTKHHHQGWSHEFSGHLRVLDI